MYCPYAFAGGNNLFLVAPDRGRRRSLCGSRVECISLKYTLLSDLQAASVGDEIFTYLPPDWESSRRLEPKAHHVENADE